MAVDIYALIERKVSGRWVMVNRCSGITTQRNSARFAALAGVCGEGLEPKGLPKDLSSSGKLYAKEWDAAAHAHSFLDLAEAARIFLATDKRPEEWAKKYPCGHYFNISDQEDKDHRLVFWFDN